MNVLAATYFSIGLSSVSGIALRSQWGGMSQVRKGIWDLAVTGTTSSCL